MDRERFDELARLLATKGSRRSAVGTLLGVAILGHDPGEAGAQRGEKARKDRNKNRNRDDGAAEAEGEAEQPVEATENAAAPEADAPEIQTEAQGGGRGKRKRKAKGRNRRSGGAQDHSRAEATRCCGTKSCALPTAGSNRFECNFAGQNLSGRTMTGVNFGKIDGRKTNFSNANVKGANFGEACLQGANFKGANVSSTNFAKACLFGADFTGARNLNPSVNFSTALLCGTVLADGTVSDRDCGRATACCAACDAQRPCPTGQVCCNSRCRAGDCCASGDCDPEQCQTVACTSFQCEYTPVPNGLGPLCNTTCCNGICCPSGQTCVGGRCTSACPPERPNRCADGSCQVCCNDNQCPTNQAPICGPNRTCLPCSSATQCSNANKGNLCCSGQCRTGVCCADAECTTPGAPDCVSNQCVCDTNTNQPCGAGLTCCTSGCENLQTDPDNCGTCGRECPDNTICSDGRCQCAQGFKPCGDLCIANALCCTDNTPGCAEPTPNCCVENGNGICRDCCGDEDCSNPTPICNGAGTCVACASDGECGDGEVCCSGSCLEGICCAADDCEPRQCRSAACTGNRCDYAVQPNGPGTLCDDEGEFCCGGSCCTEGQVCDTRPATDVCCTPALRDTTCGVGTEDPKCGTVIDNCGQEVNCGACAEVTCQTGTCNDDLDTCTYAPVPDNQTGPGCSAPGFCCDGDKCCRAGDVCLANGCCTPEPRDTTCAVNSAAPKCGDVTNNCDQTVDCGACAVRTCQAGTCNDETDLCGYTPIFGEPDPASNCTTVCCRNAEGAPVCCDAGITTCTASGLCVCAGDADCTADERCCNGSCISEELCCEGDNAEGCAGTDVCCVVDGRGDCRECCEDAQCTSPAEPVCDANGQCICPAPRVTCNTICCTTGQVCNTTTDPDTCCTPETEQQTCRPVGGSQRCGISVVNNCGQLIDCGECDPRQCFTATCNGAPDGTCQYEAVFREAGPGCDTVCCQDEQGNPVCCEEGITVCSSAGLCGCAADTDCGTDQICCDGTCIANTLCCGGDPSTCPDPGVCHERACDASGACEPQPISGSDPNDECEGTAICCDGACAACCGTDASTCAARECNSVACVGNDCAYTASGVAGPCGTNNTGICVRDPDGSGRCVISNNGTTNCIGADACGESPPGGRQCGTVNGYNNGDCACYSTPEGAGICLRRTSSFTYPESAVGCAANDAGLAAQPPCDDSTECPAGAVCVSLVGSGLPICCDRNYPACPGQNNCGKTGFCVAVEPGLCATPRPGTCVPQTPVQACGTRDCGTVSDGCSGTVNCGPLNGGCPTNETCDANGQCQPIPPPTCEECTTGCCRDGICESGSARTACGHSGGVCESCSPEVACVNGVCTCTRTSCAQGCCTVVDGKPFCDNTLRPCGDTCIARTACCHGLDASIYQETTPGCRRNETCAVNSSGFGECRCGNFRCDRNQGCCELVNGQPTCNTNLRPCGDVCIDKTLCCREGVQGCDDGLACTSETCQPATGTGQTTPPGICVQTFPNRTCTEACAAGEGYGNYFPENQREVRCASAGTVYPTQPCFCWRTTENQNVCTESVPGNITPPPCRLSSECPAGQVCIRSGMTTGTNTCAPICQ